MNTVMAKKKPRPKSAKLPLPTDQARWPDFLLALRTRLKLTQAQAAAKIAVGQGVWAAWEAGIRVPSRQSALLVGMLSGGKIK